MVEHTVAENMIRTGNAFVTAEIAYEDALRRMARYTGGTNPGQPFSEEHLNALRRHIDKLARGEDSDTVIAGFTMPADLSAITGLARAASEKQTAFEASFAGLTAIADRPLAVAAIEAAVRSTPRPSNAAILNAGLDAPPTYDASDVRTAAATDPVAVAAAESAAAADRNEAKRVIDTGYDYMNAVGTYNRALSRFARAHNITEGSADYTALTAYMAGQDGTTTGPERNEIIRRLAAYNDFDGLLRNARTVVTKRETFRTALVANDSTQAIAGEVISQLDRQMREFSGDEPERMLDTALINATNPRNPQIADQIRTAGWPNGISASYEAGRRIRNLFGEAPGNILDSITDTVGGIFGGGGNSEGESHEGGDNNFLKRMLGGAIGGFGGFMIGRLFGGGILGTIASVGLGVLGFMFGQGFFTGGDNSGSRGRGGRDRDCDTDGRSGRNRDSVTLINPITHEPYTVEGHFASERDARILGANFVRPEGVRYNPSDCDPSAGPGYNATRDGGMRFQRA